MKDANNALLLPKTPLPPAPQWGVAAFGGRLFTGIFAGLWAFSVQAAAEAPQASETAEVVRVQGKNYRWEWAKADDSFKIFDAADRPMVKGKLQPEIVAQAVNGPRRSTAGRVAGHTMTNGSLTVNYSAVNESGTASITVRFDATSIWLEPVIYENQTEDDIVEIRYFSEKGRPKLSSFFAVIPGIQDSGTVSPIISSIVGLKMTSWLGRGGPPAPGMRQQWALPVHYFCGFERSPNFMAPGAYSALLSDAFCLGLADLPAGDLFIQTDSGNHSLIVSSRSDIWHHLRGPGRLTLGTKWVFAFGSDFRAAISAYQSTLVAAGVIQIAPRSAHKDAVMAAPQLNTWGDQVMNRTHYDAMMQKALVDIYERMRRIGMRPGMFVVDAKWEGTFGNLEHDAKRLPRFEEFLAQLRQDGMRVGLWAAFMRCENPAELGLTTDHMLRDVKGQPLKRGPYYLLDFTQPEVQRGLRERARQFIRRYRPDLIKFDFGYEIPSLAQSAPRDMNFCGERMLSKGLEIVVNAMREENPDIVVMYYSLSPLLNNYIDLHSPDDLWVNAGEYDLEANRRFYFSSIMAEIGVPTYGSGGYDWGAMSEIWFDSALIGTLGSLAPLGPDERGFGPTPELIAKFNGLSPLIRSASRFRMDVKSYPSPIAATRAAHATSWARYEKEALVGVALRDRVWPEVGLQATAPVVIVSRESADLHTARRLGVVPYGDGELKLKHGGQEGLVEVRWHLVGGATQAGQAKISEGVLQLAFKERTDNGTLVEWIEIALGDK